MFFDPIEAGLYEEAIEYDDTTINLDLHYTDTDRIVMHNHRNRTSSAHYAVMQDGSILELVKPEDTNWGNNSKYGCEKD